MRVKLISSDAKDFLQKITGELLAEARREYGQGIEEKKWAIERKKWMIHYILTDESLWIETMKSPKPITTSYTTPNGDWNGEKLGSVKIRGKLMLFKNALFDVTGLYTAEEAKLLVLKTCQAERSEIDFLKSRSDKSPAKSETGREPIPERIRNEVWRRDGGKCLECGSVYNLEFDHVIPVAKGGSNTARNLRILCEPCNRRKSARIG